MGDHLDRLVGRDRDGRLVEGDLPAGRSGGAQGSSSDIGGPAVRQGERDIACRAGRGVHVQPPVHRRKGQLVAAGDRDRELGLGGSAAARGIDRDRVVASGGPGRRLGGDGDGRTAAGLDDDAGGLGLRADHGGHGPAVGAGRHDAEREVFRRSVREREGERERRIGRALELRDIGRERDIAGGIRRHPDVDRERRRGAGGGGSHDIDALRAGGGVSRHRDIERDLGRGRAGGLQPIDRKAATAQDRDPAGRHLADGQDDSARSGRRDGYIETRARTGSDGDGRKRRRQRDRRSGTHDGGAGNHCESEDRHRETESHGTRANIPDPGHHRHERPPLRISMAAVGTAGSPGARLPQPGPRAV